jgi:hypothetical protein
MAISAPSISGIPPTVPSASQDLLGKAASRYMCAGVYLDRNFRDWLLRFVYNARRSRVAPSRGFDVVVVLQHAWRAWWLELARSLALVAVLAIAWIRVPLEAVMAVSALAMWRIVRSFACWAGGVAGYYRGRDTEYQLRRMRAQGKLLGSGLLASFLALVIALVAATDASSGPRKLGAAWPSRTGLAGSADVLLACAAVVACAALVRGASLAQLRMRDPAPGRMGRRMEVINNQQQHPFIVHSGFEPFIGSGERVRGWSFAQRLIRRKELGTELDREFDTPPFTVQGLIDCLRAMIFRLRYDDHPETRLPGLAVADHVFVKGTHAFPYLEILQGPPDSKSVLDAIANAMSNPSDLARHYLACTVESWGGELVTSVFVHVSIQGRTLYLEFSTYALLPTRAEYHVIDESRGMPALAVLTAIGKELMSLPDEFLAAWRAALAPAQLWAAVRPGEDLTTSASRPRVDIGAAVSAREEAAADGGVSYFQYQDILQHAKIIERRLIAAVGDYLEGLGVDTSEFWQRAQAVLNNGVINAGPGTVNVVGSAVGSQASVSNQQPSAAS